jgi:signal peptidase I
MSKNENIIKNLFQKYKEYRKKRKEKLEAQKPQTFGQWCFSTFKTIIFALVFVMILHGLLIASFIVPTGSMENTVMTGDFLLVNKLFGPSTPQIIPFLNIPLPYAMLPSIKDPRKGDVIVFVFPGNRDEVEAQEFMYYLKRCVGEPGDTLEVKNNVLYVNGKKQPLAPNAKFMKDKVDNPMEKYHTFPASKEYTTMNYGPIVIPKKGDKIQINNEADYYDWKIFIEREGHNITWYGQLQIDGIPTNTYIVEQDYYFGMGDNRDNSADSRLWGFIPRKHILGSPIICWLSWDMYDEMGQERSVFGKIAHIRFNRMFRTIN